METVAQQCGCPPQQSGDPKGGAEIPVWVGGLQKWVTGVNKRTTCDDIIKALLRASNKGQSPDDRDLCHYALVEKWKKMERLLDGRARILKVWRSWGEDADGVKFVLKKVHPTTPREIKTLQRGGHRSGPWRQSQKLHTVHPKRLIQDDTKITHTMERLMKLIVAQGETIQAQLRRLQDKDEQIDVIEQKKHRTRMQEMGANYVIDTYLGEEETAKCHPSKEATKTPKEETASTAFPSSSSKGKKSRTRMVADDEAEEKNLQSCVRLYEQLLEVYRRLNEEEQKIIRLSAALQHETSLSTSAPDKFPGTCNAEEASSLENELESARNEIKDVTALNASLALEIAQNEELLRERHALISDKQNYIVRLTTDVEELNVNIQRLQQQQEHQKAPLSQQLPQQLQQQQKRRTCSTAITFSPAGSDDSGIQKDYLSKKELNDTDSNSDTGLSSLHSSSDDGAYPLDTLV